MELSAQRQKDVMALLYDEIKKGQPGDPEKFARIMDAFIREDCDGVILACTELSVYKGRHPVPPICLDAMDALVKESITRSGAEYI